jgi:hypothetical protein
MLNVSMLSAIMLSVIKLNMVLLNVVAPTQCIVEIAVTISNVLQLNGWYRSFLMLYMGRPNVSRPDVFRRNEME